MDRTAGWVFASIALLAAAVLRVTARDDEHSTSWLIGGVIGSVVVGVLIGLLLRFAYVKLIRKDQAVWSPWVLVIAAVVSLIVAAGRASEDDQTAGGAKTANECDAPARTAEELAAPLSRPWRSRPADEAVVDQVTGPLQEDAERVTARSIVRAGEPVAALVVIEMTEENGSQEDFFAGFESQADGKTEEAPLGSARGRLYRAPDGGATLVGFSDPCAATMILGTSPDVARELAGDLPVEG